MSTIIVTGVTMLINVRAPRIPTIIAHCIEAPSLCGLPVSAVEIDVPQLEYNIHLIMYRKVKQIISTNKTKITCYNIHIY